MTANRKKDCAVYIVSEHQDSIRQREKTILSLRESYEKMVLVTKTGAVRDNNNIITGSFPNPLGILRLLGMQEFKDKIEKYVYFPSRTILYVRNAVKRLKDYIRDDITNGNKITLITPVPSHGLAMIGLSLKKRFPEINWIVDWQDLWSYDEYYLERTPEIFKKKLLRLEKNIMNSCSMNVTTNPNARRVLETRYLVSPERVISIPHSFHRSDLSGFEPPEQGFVQNGSQREFHVGVLGNLFKPPKVPGDRVVKAVEDVNNLGMRVKLHIFGDKSERAKEVAAQSKNGRIVLYPPTTHENSLTKISSCDFFLLALSELPNCHVIMHGKLPHYLMLNRPILAMVPDNSAVADIINQTGSGYVISTASDWGNELHNILNDYTRGINIPLRNENEIDGYSWTNLSKQWLGII